MIDVIDLKKVYRQPTREVRALDGVTLHVPSNSVHGIIGQSGAGKSTLVRCLALLDRPTSGSVAINGTDLTAVSASELRRARRRLGLVFQHANLFDSRTIAHNVAYPLELAGLGKTERLAKASELLELVGLADAAGAYPAQLSGGQRQRVGIARALATDPDVLLCDEPTSALDPATTAEVLDLIAALKKRLGLSVLVITHEMNVVKRICDSVSLLNAGRVVESGSLVDAVGTFGSRLSELLLSLPPTANVASPDAATIEVLDSIADDSSPALSRLSADSGAELPVVAATVETLGGVRFGRYRVRVDPPLDPDRVIDHLQRRGAQAARTATLEESNR